MSDCTLVWLGGNRAAVIDLDDLEIAAAHTWRLEDNGYAGTRIEGRRVYLHRLIMGCAHGDGIEVDHKNGDILDCRKGNLRRVTRGQNKQNLTAYVGSTSRHRGVCWNERKQKWEASVRMDGKRVYFARFGDELEAAQAASDARARLMPFSAENTELPPPLVEEYAG